MSAPLFAIYVVTGECLGWVVKRHSVFIDRVTAEERPVVTHTHLPSLHRNLIMGHKLKRIAHRKEDNPEIESVWV